MKDIAQKVGIKGFLVVPHMLGYAAGFMHFLLLLKARLKSVLGRKELNGSRRVLVHAYISIIMLYLMTQHVYNY